MTPISLFVILVIKQSLSIDETFNGPNTDEDFIRCNKDTDCYINCIGDSVCEDVNINATLATNVYLTCAGNDACYRAELHAPNADNLIVNCTDSDPDNFYELTCWYLTINANYTKNFLLDCTNHNDSAKVCYVIIDVNEAENVQINMNGLPSSYGVGDAELYAQHVSNSFNLKCDGEISCGWTNLYCPETEYDTLCSVHCIHVDSCYSMDIFIESTDYDNLDISCSYAEGDCFKIQLNCLNTGFTSSLDYDTTTNYTACTSGLCCPEPFIQLQEQAELDCDSLFHCDIECGQCQGYLIDASDKRSLTVTCDVDSQCDYISIICPQSGTCDITCSSDYTCDLVQVMGGSTSSQISIVCPRDSSCRSMIVYGPNVGTMTMEGSGADAFNDLIIHAENVGAFNLMCYVNDMDLSCQNIDLYLPSTEEDVANIDIKCYGNDCTGWTFYVTNGMEFISQSITLISDCLCPNNEYGVCMSPWEIWCGDDYEIYARWDGSDCIGTGCGCSSIADNIATNYIDDTENEWCEDSGEETDTGLTYATINCFSFVCFAFLLMM